MAKIVSSGNTLFSSENYEKRRLVRKKRQMLLITSLLIIFIAAVFVLRIKKFHITEVSVEGAKVITEDEVERSVLEVLSANYLWLIPKANAAIYPADEVKNKLMKDFPRFSTIDLTLESPNKLNVSVFEREPFALYCPELSGQCYFLDANGFIFDEAPDFSGVVYFIYSRSEPITDPKGREYLPQEEFFTLSGFIDSLEKLGFEPVSLRDSTITMRNGSQLFWNSRDDLSHLYSNLEAFLSSPEIKAQENFLEKISTLDLRTENKVFYRFRE